MASFNEHYTTNRNAFRQQAEESYNQAAAANRSATDQYLADIDAIYKENARQLEHAYEQQKAQLPQDYQDTSATHAYPQAIHDAQAAGPRDQVELTASGHTRRQQAAINVQRSNADQAVTQQQNAQLNALSSALAEQLSQNRANQTAGAAQARYDLAARNQDLYNSYMSNADSMAASIASNLYSADQQRAAAEAQAAAEQRQAWYDYLLESEKAKSQNGGTSGMSYQDISDLAWKMAQSDADTWKIPSGQSVYDVYNTYLGQLAGVMGNTANTTSGTAGGNSGYSSTITATPQSTQAYNSILQKAQAEISGATAGQRRPYSALRVIDQAEASGQITEAQANSIIEQLGLQTYISDMASRNRGNATVLGPDSSIV